MHLSMYCPTTLPSGLSEALLGIQNLSTIRHLTKAKRDKSLAMSNYHRATGTDVELYWGI